MTGTLIAAMFGGLIALCMLCLCAANQQPEIVGHPSCRWIQARFGQLPLGAIIRYDDRRTGVLLIGVKGTTDCAIAQDPPDYKGHLTIIEPNELVDVEVAPS